MWVFGCAWKINFLKNIFNWSCVLVSLTRKWFEVKIFTSNHFRTHTERERERAQINPQIELQSNDHRPVSSHRATPTPTCTSANPHQHRSSKDRLQCRSHHADQAKIDFNAAQSLLRCAIWWIFFFFGFVSFVFLYDLIWWIFFSKFCFFCVSILRNDIIYLFDSWENVRKCVQQVENVFSMVFSRTQPNTRKYFSKHFLKCNQTFENIFISLK